MSSDLRIVSISKKDLRVAIDNNTYWNSDIVPIPKSKAIWLLANSRIEEDDYCGVIGYDGDQMVAFIYMFPDLFNSGNGTIEKLYWELLWWVNNTYKDSILGAYIFNEALSLAGNKVVVKSYAENANKFYEKQPFNLVEARLRYTIFFSLDASILLGRFSFLKHVKPLLNIADKTVGGILKWFNKRKLKTRTHTLKYHYLNKLDQETWKFIKPLCSNDLVYKTEAYINWQLDNSQYTQTPIQSKYPNKSLQIGIGNNIHIHNVKIENNDNVMCFLSYVVNYKEFNIKYFLVAKEEDYNTSVDALMEHYFDSRMNFIFTDDAKLANAINTRYTSVFTYKKEKKALAHKSIKFGEAALKIYNRDGHFY